MLNLEGERSGLVRRGRPLLVAAVLLAGWGSGNVSSSKEFVACVVDEKSTGAQSRDIATLRHALTVQGIESTRPQTLLSTGENAIDISSKVSVGDEVTLEITVGFNAFPALMTPAAAQEYADRRVVEISRSAVMHLNDPGLDNSERVTYESSRHGCQLPPPDQPA